MVFVKMLKVVQTSSIGWGGGKYGWINIACFYSTVYDCGRTSPYSKPIASQ